MKLLIFSLITIILSIASDSIFADTYDTVRTGSIVVAKVTTRVGIGSGRVIDTTDIDIAKRENIYKSGTIYEPSELSIRNRDLLPGLRKGMIGMRIGEKKKIVILPANNPARKIRIETIDYTTISPSFTYQTNIDALASDLIMTIGGSELPNFIGSQLQGALVGSTVMGSGGLTGTLISMDNNYITLLIHNTDNPFYKKSLIPGMISEKDGFEMKIKEIKDDDVVMEVSNTNSPFYGKPFFVGQSIINGAYKTKILAIREKSVTISSQYLPYGRTLNIYVEILAIR